MSAAVDRYAALPTRDHYCVFGRAVDPAVPAQIKATSSGVHVFCRRHELPRRSD